MDPVVPLCADVEVLVFLSEEAQVHVEAPDLRIGELLLHFDRLFDGRDAAHLGALRIACLDIAGTDAVDKSDATDLLAVQTFVPAAVEPAFQVGVRHDLVVDPVPVLFLLRGFEKVEARREENRAGPEGVAVREGEGVVVSEPPGSVDLRLQQRACAFRFTAEPFHDVLCR